MDQFELIDTGRRRSLDLHVVVPERIEWAKHIYADELRDMLHPIVVEGDGRSFTLWGYEQKQNGALHLLDIPTTMVGAEEAVKRRMRHPGVSHDDDEWREVEQQEVKRFAMALRNSIQTKLYSEKEQNRVRILRSDELTGDADLAWLEGFIRR
jgi:hypothetical protein